MEGRCIHKLLHSTWFENYFFHLGSHLYVMVRWPCLQYVYFTSITICVCAQQCNMLNTLVLKDEGRFFFLFRFFNYKQFFDGWMAGWMDVKVKSLVRASQYIIDHLSNIVWKSVSIYLFIGIQWKKSNQSRTENSFKTFLISSQSKHFPSPSHWKCDILMAIQKKYVNVKLNQLCDCVVIITLTRLDKEFNQRYFKNDFSITRKFSDLK